MNFSKLNIKLNIIISELLRSPFPVLSVTVLFSKLSPIILFIITVFPLNSLTYCRALICH